jgi:hypothetical protein
MAAPDSLELAREALESRVAAMDAAAKRAQADPTELIRAFAVTMGAISDRGIPEEQTPVVDPMLCDEIVARSGAIRRLGEAAPWLTAGPLAAGSEQEWVATGRPSWLPPRISTPNRDSFQDVTAAGGEPSPRGPVRGGLFTCTATAAQPGMWRTYLQTQGENMLWPKPWHVWRMKPATNLKIYQVSSAQAWAALVRQHHHQSNGFLRPEWRSIAGVADALHISPAAACAIDGLSLATDRGPVAPTYWTVESTFWMHWCFDDDFGIVHVNKDG